MVLICEQIDVCMDEVVNQKVILTTSVNSNTSWCFKLKENGSQVSPVCKQ